MLYLQSNCSAVWQQTIGWSAEERRVCSRLTLRDMTGIKFWNFSRLDLSLNPIYTTSPHKHIPLPSQSPTITIYPAAAYNDEQLIPMSHNDIPTPQITVEDSSGLTTLAVDPPMVPIATSLGLEGASSTRTSFTRVDNDDVDHRRPSTSHDPVPDVPSNPAPHDGVQPPPLISATSQDQSESPPSSTEPGMSPPQPQAVIEEPVPQTPQIYISFLLISGRRRTMSFEPETAVGRVKELAWNSWPAGTSLGHRVRYARVY